MLSSRYATVLLVFAFLPLSAANAQDVLLFPYFDSNGENGVYLSWSVDGRNFFPINGGDPIFTPPQWPSESLTRDPSIAYHDGLFHMVWTSDWSGNVLGHATSPDLVSWSTPQQIQPFPNGSEQPNNVWAPEIFHDHVAGDFKVVWSSTLDSELYDGDGSEDSHGNDHRMYYISTSDFQSFSTPELLFQDEGYSVIDAHVVYDDRQNGNAQDDRWIMSLKKEQGTSAGGKNIRLAFSDPAISPSSFGQTTAPVVGPGTDVQSNSYAEGPSMVRWNDEWLLYWDAYSAGHYAMASSTDLVDWTDQTDLLSFPVGHPRHGTVFAATMANTGWDIVRPADLNRDGAVNSADWVIFLAHHLTDLSGYPSGQLAELGDLDGDGDNDFDDFRAFKTDYESLYGAGALADLMRAVPEPGTGVLLVCCLAVVALAKRHLGMR